MVRSQIEFCYVVNKSKNLTFANFKLTANQ